MKKEDIKIGTVFEFDNEVGYIYEMKTINGIERCLYITLKNTKTLTYQLPGKESFFEIGSIKQRSGAILK